MLAPLIGRGTELRELRRLIARERLVCLTGPGGVGKTSLALEVASKWRGDLRWVDLAPLTDAASVRPAVDSALQHDKGSDPVLLVLDNCEHQRQSIAHELASILERPGTSVLATSREPLGHRGECLYQVQPLAAPDSHSDSDPRLLTSAPATALLLERIARQRPHYDPDSSEAKALSELARRVDGLPLALELAAPWVAALGARAVLDRLSSRPGFLADPSGSANRHHSLEPTMSWGHEILSPSEQVMLRRLSVFTSWLELDLVTDVCGGSGLEGEPALHMALLVRRSFVAVAGGKGAPRHRLLETVRQFAADRLEESGEASAITDRYCSAMAEYAERAYEHRHLRDQSEWLAGAATRLNDVLQAARMRLAADPAAALTMVGAVTWATDPLGYADEALRIMELALRASPERSAARARACCAAAILHDSFGRPQAMRPLMDEALEIGIEVGDKWREAFCLVNLAGDDDRPEAYRAECLDRANRIAEELSDDFLLVSIRAQMAGRLETSVAEIRALGLSWQLASGLSELALGRLAAGDQRGALEAAQEAVRIAASGGDEGFFLSSFEAGAMVVAGSRPELALRLTAAAARLREELAGATVLGRPAGLEQAMAAARTAAGGRASFHEKAGRRADVDSLIASLLEAPAVVGDILKPRQREILQLVATGARNREIAERTHLSVRTIEWHLEQLAVQLRVKGRAGLAAWAAANQLP